ncbi:leucine-rich repeat and immunoglobulin-like domain-containing nogo receptor-interacting protein 3 isoform X2 [Amphibalanus amphitrite]|nr:leucine-rich repeat and immunoglobulin-like domain-containing nogo receptor-interacting protein 3 isoform X2 [Amphibalanus amphitrite]
MPPLLLLLLLSAAAAGAGGCPVDCSCPSVGTALCRGWPAAAALSNVTRLEVRGAAGSPPNGLFANASLLETLQLRDCARLRLAERSLVGLHLLRHLAAPDCGLAALPAHGLALLPRLEELDLSGNRLTRLHRHQFTYNTHLARLNLSGNPLAGGVHSEAFFGAERLRDLDLSGCRLRRAPGAWFRRLPALQRLVLAGNELTSVRRVDTRDWRSLRHLDLSANAISHVERGAFNASTNLTHVNLSGNYLSEFLGTGLNCSELDLSNNSFTVANRSYVELPGRLRALTLTNCGRLMHVGRNLLQFSLGVQTVNISSNGMLTEIEHTTFSHLDRLKVVDLSGNALEKLPRSLSTATLDTLELVDNNFSCDCSLQWYSRAHPLSPLTCRMGDSTARLADGLAHVLCEPVSVTVHQTQAWAPYNATATLECQPAGHPAPALTWITPQRYVFHWVPEDADDAGDRLHPDRHTAHLDEHRELDHYRVLSDGRLQISGVAERHRGRYVCLAEGDAGSAAGGVYLTVGVNSLHDVKMMALLMALTGCVTAITFALVVRLGLYIFYKCGCCICCTDELPPRAKIKGMVDSMEQWRALQLASLRESYNQQVAGIKDSCYQQVERIRDTYKGQARYVSDMRDYGAQQIEGFREQYLDQVRRVRDYSLGQMNRVHENYIFQRNRIRKFSAHQRVRLRETYKYQQKTLNKLLETLPDLYLQNCRTGTCQRTESMMLPGDQHFYCDADVEWSAEQLAAMADLYPPGEQLDATAEEGEEPELPTVAGAELTRRLLALAPALEAADREAARLEAEREQEEQGEGARRRQGGVRETDGAAAEQLLAAARPLGAQRLRLESHDPEPESESADEWSEAPPASPPAAPVVVTAAAVTAAAPAPAAVEGERAADAPLRVRAVRSDGVCPSEVEVVVLERGRASSDDGQAESSC